MSSQFHTLRLILGDQLNASHRWSLYHSRLSFALNSKMLHPMQVINAALTHYRANTEQADTEKVNIAQVESFVRQTLGWREFVRGDLLA